MSNPVDRSGHEQHPLLHQPVQDIASKCVGVLDAVTHETHSDGRTVRIAHVRPSSGITWTTHADNIEPA
ncbi:hypothetical protein ACFYUL_17830 [Streptomyces sp. NPDC004311]|uniref:hypothetical protein n=1 Tax=Streptomyces sp. NPDC004311 TaxID=3364698 RepID=UPI00369B68A0